MRKHAYSKNWKKGATMVLCTALLMQCMSPAAALGELPQVQAAEGEENRIDLVQRGVLDFSVWESAVLSMEEQGGSLAFRLSAKAAPASPETESGSATETVTETETLTETETETETITETESFSETELPSETETESTVQTETASETEADDMTVTETATETGSATEAETETGSATEAETETGSATEAETETGSTTEAETETGSTTEAETETGSTTEAVSEPVTESAADAAEPEKSAEPITNTNTDSGQPDSEEAARTVTVEKTLVEMASLHAEAVPRNVSALSREKETLNLSMEIEGDITVQEDIQNGSVTMQDENGSGDYTLSKTGKGVRLEAELSLPAQRPDGYEITVTFSLKRDFASVYGAKLVWNADRQAICVEKTGNLLGLMRRAEAAPVRTAESIPETSRELTVDMTKAIKSAGFSPDIYDSFILNAVTSRASAEVKVELKAVMKKAYFEEKFERYVTEFLSDPTVEYTPEKFAAWMKDGNKEAPIKFEYTFTGFKLTNDMSSPHKGDFELDGTKLGEYNLTEKKTADGIECVVLSGEMDMILYAFAGVSFGDTFSLKCTEEIKEGEIPVLEAIDGELRCTGKEMMYLEGDPSPAHPYILTKSEIEKNEHSPFVIYAIDLEGFEGVDTAVGHPLAGQIVKDELPPELLLSELSIAYEDKEHDQKRTVIPKEDYELSGQTLSYTFPDDKTDAYSATLYVKTVLSPTALADMQKGTVNFQNRAWLEGITNKDGTPIEDNANGSRNFQTFQKSVDRDEKDGMRFHWTIDVDAFYKGSVNFYLVDKLDPTSHDYDRSTNVRVEIGTIDEAGNFSSYSQDKYLEWEEINASSENAIDYENVSADTLSELTNGSEKACVYTSKNETGGAHERVMALKLDNLMDSGAHLKIHYDTRITKDLTDASDNKLTLDNYADLRSKNFRYGIGPGSGEYEWDFDYKVEKPADAVMNVVTKKAADNGYNEETKIQKWLLDVNYCGGEYKDLIIEEDLSESTQQMFPNPVVCSIIAVKGTGTGFTVNEIPAGTAGSAKPYYEITNKKMLIHLGEVEKDDYFTIELDTKFGGDVTAQQSGNISVTNPVRVYDGTAGESKPYTAEATVNVPNVLIEKKAYGLYNSADHTLSWEVTVNPNALNIMDGKIMDILPEGNTFGKLTEVTYDGNTFQPSLTGESGSDSFVGSGLTVGMSKTDAGSYIADETSENNEHVTFTVNGGKIEKNLVLKFTTELTAAHRNAILTAAAEQRAVSEGIYSYQYTNYVELEGKVKDDTKNVTTVITNAHADAAQAIRVPMLYKEGEYNKDNVGVITWTAIVNGTGADLAQTTIRDHLNTTFQEYREKSLKIQKITDVKEEEGKADYKKGDPVFDAGIAAAPVEGIQTSADKKITVTYKKQSDADDYETDKSGRGEAGFDIKFSPGDTSSYLLTFDTVIVNDAYPADLRNTMVCLYNNDKAFSSNQAESGLDSKFSVNDYMTGSVIPVLIISKKSSTEGGDGDNPLDLANAKFKMRIMEWEITKKEYTKGDEIRVRSTMENGKRLFVNMQPDVMYALYEETAPLGYEKSEKPWFIYFQSKTGPDLTEEMIKAAKQAGVELVQGKTLCLRATMKNTPCGESKVEFTKNNSNGQVLADVNFQLTDDTGKLKPFEATSNSGGVVTFKNVDPGTYTLNEVEDSGEVYNAYTLLQKSKTKEIIKVKVTGTEKGSTYTITSDKPTGSALAGDSSSGYTITNSLADADLEITKEDENTKKPIEGVTYNLKGMDKEGKYFGGVESGITVRTNISGKAVFKAIPVSDSTGYTLTETYPPAYQQNENQTTAAYNVMVTAGTGSDAHKAKVEITKNSDAPNSEAPAPQATSGGNIQNKAGDTARVTFTNKPLSGTITFTKNGFLRDGTTVKPQVGARFGLYAKAAGGSSLQEVVSDAAGMVSFANVDAGQIYYIREIAAPNGFIKSDEAVKVDLTAAGLKALEDSAVTEKDKIAYSNDGVSGKRSFTYILGSANQIKTENRLAKAVLDLEKKDQNGRPLAGVSFAVSRYGAEEEFGTVDKTAVTKDDLKWTAYRLDGKVSGSADANYAVTDEKGEVSLGTLEAGIYKLAEQESDEHAAIAAVEPFYLEVTADDKGEPKVQYYETLEKLYDDNAEAVKLSADGVGTLQIENMLQYGLIQIRKVAAVRQEDGIVHIQKRDGKAVTIENVTFEVYRAADIAGGDKEQGPWSVKNDSKPVVTLRTNEQGQLTAANGLYTDINTTKTVYLTKGVYFIRETAAPEGYAADDSLYRVALDTAGNSYAADHLTLKENYAGNWTDPEGNLYFLNEINRAEVILDKRSSQKPDRTLSGADFIVWTQSGKPVAALKEKDNSGSYYLSDEKPESLGTGRFTEKNEQELPFLKKEAGSWKLLPGSYYVTEVKSPAGYQPDLDDSGNPVRYEFTIGAADVSVKVSNTGNTSKPYVTNQPGRQNLTVTKAVTAPEKVLAAAAEEQKNPAGFGFTIQADTLEDPEAVFADVSKTTDVEGKAEFTDLPYGTFVLSETLPKDRDAAYSQVLSYRLEITADGVKAAPGQTPSQEVEITQTGGAAGKTGADITVTNTLQSGSITGNKLGTAGNTKKPLAGAVFGLYRAEKGKAGAAVTGKDGKPLQAVTDENGIYAFENIPCGTWYIKEESAPEDFAEDTGAQSGMQVVLTAGTKNDNALTEVPVVLNELAAAAIKLEKTDSGAVPSPVSGAEFTVYAVQNGKRSDEPAAVLREDGTTGSYTLQTADNAAYLEKGVNAAGYPYLIQKEMDYMLTAGSYCAVETKTPEGFEGDSAEWNFTIGKTDHEKVLQHTVTNARSFTWAKMQTDTSFAVPGARFALYLDRNCKKPYEVNGTQVRAESGENGLLTIRDLSPGTYYLKEESVPEPYLTENEPYRLELADNASAPALLTADGTPLDVAVVEEETFPVVYNSVPEEKRIDIEVVLTSTSGDKITDTPFELWLRRADGIRIRFYAKGRTDAFGRLLFANVPVFPDENGYDGYEIVQTDTSGKYEQIQTEPYEVKMQDLREWKEEHEADESMEVPVQNLLRKEENNSSGGGSDGKHDEDTPVAQPVTKPAEKLQQPSAVTVDLPDLIPVVTDEQSLSVLAELEQQIGYDALLALRARKDREGKAWEADSGLTQEQWDVLYLNGYKGDRLPKTGGAVGSILLFALGVLLLGFGIKKQRAVKRREQK